MMTDYHGRVMAAQREADDVRVYVYREKEGENGGNLKFRPRI